MNCEHPEFVASGNGLETICVKCGEAVGSSPYVMELTTDKRFAVSSFDVCYNQKCPRYGLASLWGLPEKPKKLTKGKGE